MFALLEDDEDESDLLAPGFPAPPAPVSALGAVGAPAFGALAPPPVPEAPGAAELPGAVFEAPPVEGAIAPPFSVPEGADVPAPPV
jgi:hypothetical protein